MAEVGRHLWRSPGPTYSRLPRTTSRWLLKTSKLINADKIYLRDTHFLPSYASLPGKTNMIKQVVPKINQQIQ